MFITPPYWGAAPFKLGAGAPAVLIEIKDRGKNRGIEERSGYERPGVGPENNILFK
jgi:hypothetical protein